MWSVERGSSKAARFESSCFIVRAPMIVEVTPGRLWTHASETAATCSSTLCDLLQLIQKIVSLIG